MHDDMELPKVGLGGLREFTGEGVVSGASVGGLMYGGLGRWWGGWERVIVVCVSVLRYCYTGRQRNHITRRFR